MASQLKLHYEAVLKDLETEREAIRTELVSLQKRLREVDTVITGISRRVSPCGETVADVVTQPGRVLPADSPKYASMSARWAALIHLSETNEPLSTAEIAEALQAGGVRTNANNFNNNVSAILSNMKTVRGEVDVADGKWTLTEVGRSAADHIRMSKLRRRFPRTDRQDADAG